MGLSVVIHSVLTPWAALLGLLGLLGLSDHPPAEELPPITAIPIELIEDAPPTPSSTDPEPAEEPAAAVVVQPSPPQVVSPNGNHRVPEPEQKPPEEQGAGKGQEQKDPEEAGRVGDPVALSGAAGKLADSGAKVRIKIDTDKVRRHALGPRIGEVLGRVPQWYDFLGPAKLDPIRDIDRLLIAGPQLRDSSEVVAVLQYNVPQPAMESAIDNLVQRSSGEWISGATRAATARADRAERVFAFFAPGLLAIVPPSAKRDALKRWPKGTRLGPIPGEVVLVATVDTPSRVYTGLPFKFPPSFKWIRASVTPTADGGAIANIEAEDESDDAAREHAAWLERIIWANAAPQGFRAAAAKYLFGSDKFLEEVSFKSESTRIHGSLRISESQLKSLLTMVEGIIESWNPKPAASSVPAGSASATPSVPDTASSAVPNPYGAEDAAAPAPSAEPHPDSSARDPSP
jgi:hypothetical protein